MNSGNFKKYKREIGQANHYLITIMVGLDAVKNGAQKDDAFQTSWNPRDVSASVNRSKQYAIKSSLAWAVDNLDMYLRLCNRNPKLYQENESLEIAGTKHSVYNKFKCVVKNHLEITANKKAFVDLLICWRNNMVHFDAENDLLPESKKYFANIPEDDFILNQYHLDTTAMLIRFYNRNVPTFKEATTMISMAIHFVEELDQQLMAGIQQATYLESNLRAMVKKDPKALALFNCPNTTPDKRVKRFKQLFATAGINEDFYNEDGEEFLKELANMNAKEFIDYHKN